MPFIDGQNSLFGRKAPIANIMDVHMGKAQAIAQYKDITRIGGICATNRNDAKNTITEIAGSFDIWNKSFESAITSDSIMHSRVRPVDTESHSRQLQPVEFPHK